MRVASWAALINGLGGWLSLSTIVCLSDPAAFIRNLVRPIRAIKNDGIRRVFEHPASGVASLIIFLVTALLVASNVAVEISSTYEDFACLPAGNNRGTLIQGERTGHDLRIKEAQPVRLLLRGWRASEILLLRDQYNLTTLEALEVRRTFLGFAIKDLDLSIGDQTLRAADKQPLVDRLPPFRLAIRDHLAFGMRAVLVALVSDGAIIPGHVLLGEPGAGPENPPGADNEVRVYFQTLWDARDEFAQWPEQQASFEQEWRALDHPVKDYQNRVVFREGKLGGLSGTRPYRTQDEPRLALDQRGAQLLGL